MKRFPIPKYLGLCLLSAGWLCFAYSVTHRDPNAAIKTEIVEGQKTISAAHASLKVADEIRVIEETKSR